MCKEYEIKTKVVQEQQLQLENCYLVGGGLIFDRGDKNLVGKESNGRGFLQVGDEQIFGWWGGLPHPPVGKTLDLPLQKGGNGLSTNWPSWGGSRFFAKNGG